MSGIERADPGTDAGEGASPDAGESLAGPFWRWAQRSPERPALWADGEVVSYGELACDAARIAGFLAAHGLGSGARVGVLGERGRDAIAAILGTSLAGAAYVPLSPQHPSARIAALLARAQLHALVTDAAGDARLDTEVLAQAPDKRLALAVTSAGAGHASAQPLTTPARVAPDALAYLMFTSGTTGEPKGVMVPVRAVRHYLDVIAERYTLSPQDRVSQFFELTFDLSVHDLFATLSAGAQLFVLPRFARFAPVQFAAEHELSVWFSVPSTAAFLVRVGLGEDVLPSLRLSLFCGEALPLDSATRWRAAAPASRVENLYGPTEATIACLAQPCGTGPAAAPPRVTEGRGCVAIGTPLTGTLAAVVDPGGSCVARGESGELALAGPQLALGYWRDPETTARSFIELDHPELGTARWYLTGDLARQDEDGVFHHLGRIDHQVQVQGHRVELEEIDAHLRAVSGSDSAIAVAWPIESGIAGGIVAFVSGSSLPPPELLALLRARLPAYMVPRRIVTLDELPRSAHGKLDRGALARRLEQES